MGYFKNTTVLGGGGCGGALWVHYDFVVSGSIMIKFGVLIEVDKFLQNNQKKKLKNDFTTEL